MSAQVARSYCPICIFPEIPCLPKVRLYGLSTFCVEQRYQFTRAGIQPPESLYRPPRHNPLRSQYNIGQRHHKTISCHPGILPLAPRRQLYPARLSRSFDWCLSREPLLSFPQWLECNPRSTLTPQNRFLLLLHSCQKRLSRTSQHILPAAAI